MGDRAVSVRRMVLLILVMTLLPAATSAAGVQCRGQKGEAVDWYIVYKMPKIHHKQESDLGQGVAQFYLDGNNPHWTLSPQPINATSGHAVYYTLEQIYESKTNDLLYIMFNDERPTGSISLNHGHAKGVLGFDSSSGFWLIHSAPKFPPNKSEGYSWSDNASDYGQTFLCVSFTYKSLEILAKQLLFYYIEQYDSFFPDQALKDFPELRLIAHNCKMKDPPYFSVRSDLTTVGGMPLVSFAKFTSFGADLYDALVAPTLKVALDVETWRNGKGDLTSNCSIEYYVYNVAIVQLPGSIKFNVSKDHSKYAVSRDSNSPWVCVGGINRQSTQFKRGGGTMCFQNPQVWSTYHNTVVQVDGCPSVLHFFSETKTGTEAKDFITWLQN